MIENLDVILFGILIFIYVYNKMLFESDPIKIVKKSDQSALVKLLKLKSQLIKIRGGLEGKSKFNIKIQLEYVNQRIRITERLISIIERRIYKLE